MAKKKMENMSPKKYELGFFLEANQRKEKDKERRFLPQRKDYNDSDWSPSIKRPIILGQFWGEKEKRNLSKKSTRNTSSMIWRNYTNQEIISYGLKYTCTDKLFHEKLLQISLKRKK